MRRRAGDTPDERRPLRVALLVPELLPGWLKNSDIHQNRTLLSLGDFTGGGLVCRSMPALPNEMAVAALAPLAAARGLGWLRAHGAFGLDRAERTLLGAAWISRPLEADVVLGHGLFPLYAPWVSRRLPLLWGPGYDPGDALEERPRAADLARMRRRLKAAALVFLTNPASAEALRADFHLPASAVRVLPYFQPHLPTADLAPSARVCGEGPLRVLFLGREARRKNLAGVLGARRQLRDQGLTLDLTVVSDFRDGAVPIDRDVTLLGPVSRDEAFALMREHDVLCMPSFRESYGMVFIEALAAGTAVVAPDFAVQRSMLENAGTYADPHDVGSISTALRELMSAERRAAKVAHGEHLYRARYAPDVVARGFEEALRAACRSISRPA